MDHYDMDISRFILNISPHPITDNEANISDTALHVPRARAIFSPTIRPPVSSYFVNSMEDTRPRTSSLNEPSSQNMYFNLYKTMKDELEESHFIVDNIHDMVSSADNQIPYHGINKLKTEIQDFKESLNTAHNEYMTSVDEYKTMKSKQEKNLKLLKSCIQMIDSDDENDEDDENNEDTLSSQLKCMIEDYILKNYDHNILKGKAENLENKRNILYNYIDLSVSIKNIQPLPVCPVCLDSIVDVVFVNCGHTCCSKCSRPLVKCHVCRKRITKKQTIYL